MRFILLLASKSKRKVWISLLLLMGVWFGAPLRLSSANSLPFRHFKAQWVTASDQDVLNARCSKKIPFTDREMKDWLGQKANEGSQKIGVKVHGIELADESPYLVSLLRALLTASEDVNQSQRTFESKCNKTLCAARELFGEREGIQLLFMLGRFGFNGSHLRVSDASAWTSQELDTVLLALSDLPQELIPPSPLDFNRQLTHYRRGKLNPSSDDSLATITSSFLKVYDTWDSYSVEMQRYALYHELGHVFGYETGLHTSRRWYEHRDQPAISKYAERSQIEDFAESFAAYRYNPEKLKKLVPETYDFMKSEVFKNTEYTENGACHVSYSEPLDVLAALDRLKESMPSDSASLSWIVLSDNEVERARQECLSGPRLVSAFVSGKLLRASAQCVQKSEMKRALENVVDQSIVLKGLNAEWLSRKMDQHSLAGKDVQMKCSQNCKNLAQKGLNQLERAIELVLVGYIDLGEGRDRQSVQKFCSDLSFTNANLIRGYDEVQELIGDHGMIDFVDSSVQVCKVIQGKFKKRKAMDADQIEAAFNQLYPIVR